MAKIKAKDVLPHTEEILKKKLIVKKMKSGDLIVSKCLPLKKNEKSLKSVKS